MNNPVRWKQRFQNFERAYLLLNDDIEASIESMSEREKSGVIQHFQLAFELSWNILKDYLENEGIKIKGGPRTVLKEAFKLELINDGEKWLKSLEKRNKSTHLYDAKIMNEIINFIPNEFYPLIRSLYFDLKKEI